MENKAAKYFIITTFVLLYVITSAVSTIHVIDFFRMSNPDWLAITLAIAYEIGAAASLASLIALRKMNKGIVWALFIILTAMQAMGNVYYAYIHLNNYQPWIELFGLIEEDPIFQKRIIAIVSGAVLPLVALGFIKSLVDYIKPENEDKISEGIKSEDIHTISENVIETNDINEKDKPLINDTSSNVELEVEEIDKSVLVANVTPSISGTISYAEINESAENILVGIVDAVEKVEQEVDDKVLEEKGEEVVEEVKEEIVNEVVEEFEEVKEEIVNEVVEKVIDAVEENVKEIAEEIFEEKVEEVVDAIEETVEEVVEEKVEEVKQEVEEAVQEKSEEIVKEKAEEVVNEVSSEKTVESDEKKN